VLSNYLIGLREGLEAGLIVGILVAYLGKTGRRQLLGRLWMGIAAAIAVSLGVGALLTWGPYALTFEAQEILGGVLSLLAVAMVTWMIFWMATHGASLSQVLHGHIDSATVGSWFAIVTVGALSVGREGLETALFVWANVSSGTDATLGTVGALLGIVTAAALAWAISRGLVRINLSRFFTWTGLLLIIVAAGVLAYGIGDLQEANLLPGLGAAAYNLQSVVPPGGWFDATLRGIFNFRPDPTWPQVIAWTTYGLIVTVTYLRVLRRRAARVGVRVRSVPVSSPRESVGAVPSTPYVHDVSALVSR